jgi:3-deoxy-7-phosphoheptulonate synthase
VVPNDPIIDRRIAEIRPLVPPRQLADKLPLSDAHKGTVLRGRESIRAALDGEDDRLIVVVGPCSVHDPVAALEYAHRLALLAAEMSGELVIVMRVYFEKPRTTVGWKGLINDPGMDDTFEVNEGLFVARDLLLQVLGLGLPVGCEFLDPITPQFIADAVSWGAIGARTTQSQIHRQLASGLSMPVGFKNTTEGDVQGAVDAIVAAAGGQVFPGITTDGDAAIFSTTGNPDCHVILRGGAAGPNYDQASVDDTVARLERANLPARVLIDVSHGNSAKEYQRQPLVAADIAARIAAGERRIVGVMLESFLVEGRQDLTFGHASELTFGQSVTDACIGWDSTVAVLNELAGSVRRRRVWGDRLVRATPPGRHVAR